MFSLRSLRTVSTLKKISKSNTSSFSSSTSALISMEESIRQKLTTSLTPTHLKVSNDSAAHAGHSAMRAQGGGNGETHFSVQVVSELFEGKRAVARHRLVNDALKEEFEKGLHALVIQAKTPAEYAK